MYLLKLVRCFYLIFQVVALITNNWLYTKKATQVFIWAFVPNCCYCPNEQIEFHFISAAAAAAAAAAEA